LGADSVTAIDEGNGVESSNDNNIVDESNVWNKV
jgi:hypothetical protein